MVCMKVLSPWLNQVLTEVTMTADIGQDSKCHEIFYAYLLNIKVFKCFIKKDNFFDTCIQ